ncbi:MAG: GNAT family N-acetyltransferase [Nocardioidaceae bacterium]
MSEVTIRNVPERGRYEAKIDGVLVGTSDYVILHGVIVFTHAEVKPSHTHRGIASELARRSLEDARDELGLKVKTVCSFYRWYIQRHPQYADLVA